MFVVDRTIILKIDRSIMNSRQAKGKRRAYDNRLREEQGQKTRERILEAATALLAEGGDSDYTIAHVAERAGVSEPTIYRHFGSRDRLHDAMDEHLRAHIGMPPTLGVRLEELPRVAARLYRQFGQNAQILRAALRSGLAREIRAGAKVKRDRQMRSALAPYTKHLEKADAHGLAAVYRVLLGWETWDRLTGELEVDPTMAAGVIAWAVEAFNEKLERERAAGRATLRTEGEE
jgi:AcrR family transcriptional regulator